MEEATLIHADLDELNKQLAHLRKALEVVNKTLPIDLAARSRLQIEIRAAEWKKQAIEELLDLVDRV